MKQHLSIFAEKKHEKSAMAKGLAPIVCYDPWFPRALESIKQSINDGYPVLVRLHSAASYPVNSEERYTIDLESHAVLIVGYDDAKQAVALIDPWDRKWGGNQSGRWWLSYSTLGIKVVDCSLGMSMSLAPLQVIANTQSDHAGNFLITMKIGFYISRGTIMDRHSWTINAVRVTCGLPESWGGGKIDYETTGHWLVGDILDLSLPITNNPQSDGEISLSVIAVIGGKRPYNFEDTISVQKKIFVKAVSKTSEEFCLSNLA